MENNKLYKFEINKGVVNFELQDWASNILGSYDTLDKAEEHKERLVDEGETEEEQDEISEDLYIIGYDEEGNEKPVNFG